MSLKCPFCGKEYFYDSKICQTCEDQSINNIGVPENYTYVHYELTSAFGRKKPDKSYINIASEPKFTDFNPKEDNTWNCNSRFKSKNLLTIKSGISQLRSLENLPTKNSTILEKEIAYE